MRQSRPASAVHTPSSQCGALVCQGLARADPRVHFFRTFLHVLRVVRWYPTPLAPLPSARCACRGRCFQSSCASLGTPRCWSLCLEGLYRKRRTAPLVRLCSAWFPRSSTVVLPSPPGFVPEVIRLGCSGSSSSRRHPSQVISLSTDAIVVWLSQLRPPGCTPTEALCDSSQLSPLRLAVCLVVSGHSSTQTCSN